MSQKEQQVDAPVKKSSGAKRLLIVCGIVFLLIAAVVWLFVSMLFTSPYSGPYQEPDILDWFNQAAIGNRLARKAKKNPQKLCTIKVSEQEVNSAIRCGVFGYEKYNKKKTAISPRDLRLEYKNSLFCGVIPLDTGIRFLNGGVLEIRFAAKITKMQNKVIVDVKEIHAGKIKLPSDKVNERVREYLASPQVQKNIEELNEVIESFEILSDGRVQISCYPDNVLALIMKRNR